MNNLIRQLQDSHNVSQATAKWAAKRIIELERACEDAAEFLKPRSARADLVRGSDASHLYKTLRKVLDE